MKLLTKSKFKIAIIALFPNGIRYNRKKQYYRTQRVNQLFSDTYVAKNKKRETILNDFPQQVGVAIIKSYTLHLHQFTSIRLT